MLPAAPQTARSRIFSFLADPLFVTGLRRKDDSAYARSNCAYFSTSFFKPKRGNCTVILASSPSPSRRYTVPSPYFGCRTFCPGRNPRLPVGSSTGGAFGTLNFFPRLAKNSAMLSIELYALAATVGFDVRELERRPSPACHDAL